MKIVSEALNVPIVRDPTYPYNPSHTDDVMSLLCGKPDTWGSEPRIHSHEIIEYRDMLLRIACYIVFPISHIHTIPIDRCVFVYALNTNGSISFSSLFIQTIIEAHRSKSKKHALYFLVFIHRILEYLQLEDFPAFDPIHLTAPIGASFLREQSAQLKIAEPSAGSSKRPRVETFAVDPSQPPEERHFNPMATVANDGVDEVDLDGHGAQIVDPSVPPHLSLRSMMETFMTTKAAHG